MWYNRGSCGYRIAAIMYPSQGWDQGPTPCTRTRKRRKSRRLFICFLIWLKGGGPVESDRTSERAKIGNLFTIFWATRNGRLLLLQKSTPCTRTRQSLSPSGALFYDSLPLGLLMVMYGVILPSSLRESKRFLNSVKGMRIETKSTLSSVFLMSLTK